MLELSPLNHTWILDVDGTLVKHNGYLIDGHDTLLNGVKEFFAQIPQGDTVILLTAREEKYLPPLKEFLSKNDIRYDYLLADIPTGERILVNDEKQSGLKTAYAINKARDEKFQIEFAIRKDI